MYGLQVTRRATRLKVYDSSTGAYLIGQIVKNVHLVRQYDRPDHDKEEIGG